MGTRRCSEEIGGSCEEISDDAADIEDDGSRNQIRDRDGSEDMENADAGETHEKMDTENVPGDVCVLGTGRETTKSQTSLDMQLRRDAG